MAVTRVCAAFLAAVPAQRRVLVQVGIRGQKMQGLSAAGLDKVNMNPAK
jgi:hypothetical protein